MNQPLLTQELLSQLQGAPIQQLSGQLGLDPQQAGTAVAAALPLLMGALGRNSAQPQGARAVVALRAKPTARRSWAISSAVASRARRRRWARAPAWTAARR